MIFISTLTFNYSIASDFKYNLPKSRTREDDSIDEKKVLNNKEISLLFRIYHMNALIFFIVFP